MNYYFVFSIEPPTTTSTPVLSTVSNSSSATTGVSGVGGTQPSLPPKPNTGSNSPPPYVPAPPPVSSSSTPLPGSTGGSDSTITVVKGNNYSNQSNLSVSTHPAEEGTSVDDDMPSASEAESEDR